MNHSVILLPWPARALHPNARGHFMARARATKKARHDAWLATLAAVPAPRRAELQAATKLRAHVRFFPPDNRNRDEDGMVSSVKSQLDGIADALAAGRVTVCPPCAFTADLSQTVTLREQITTAFNAGKAKKA
ncbi:MAG: hypothetical protein KAX54_00005, partial [Thauera sp.]|nr:hypothetical protein [Thauera sp.]